MSKTVIGVFRDYNEAEAVLNDFVNHGFTRENISLITSDRTGPTASAESHDATAKTGAGAAIGGVAGLVVGLAALAIPGIGPIVAAGPLAAALTGAGVGAAEGGMIGALTQAGVPRAHATSYADAVKEGGTIVAIRVDSEQVDSAKSILNRHGAVDINETNDDHAVGRTSGRETTTVGDEGSPSEWGKRRLSVEDRNLGTGRTGARVYDPEQSVVPDVADAELRQHYESAWYPKYSWEDFSDAYRFGYSLGASSRYGTSDWVDVEGEARRNWELRRPESWTKFKDAVRFGWDHVRGKK
jgi:hypothetical protein